MTATTQPVQPPRPVPNPTDQPGPRSGTSGPATGNTQAAHLFGGLARHFAGVGLLWAFLDKTFGLGFATTVPDLDLESGLGDPPNSLFKG